MIRQSRSSYRFLLRSGLADDADSPGPGHRFSPQTIRAATRPLVAPVEPTPRQLRAVAPADGVQPWPDQTVE